MRVLEGNQLEQVIQIKRECGVSFAEALSLWTKQGNKGRPADATDRKKWGAD